MATLPTPMSGVPKNKPNIRRRSSLRTLANVSDELCDAMLNSGTDDNLVIAL